MIVINLIMAVAQGAMAGYCYRSEALKGWYYPCCAIGCFNLGCAIGEIGIAIGWLPQL